ncbi:MAG: SRPBCC family protein [Kofleriaceae bacterium]|nr:SRPBCC family protein [Kofleriaceae bacterium]MBP6841465.1 SRPBCC family protein [Kofleriaceae bacterium]
MTTPTGRLDGNDLVLTRRFHAPIEDVWTSLTASDSTARWYGSWTGTPGTGNTIAVKLLFEQGAPESNAHIDACEPPRRLALSTTGEWGVRIEVTLTHQAGVTELRFVHHLTDRELARDMGPGWEYYLDNLVAARAGTTLPTFDQYYPSMKPYYSGLVDAAG